MALALMPWGTAHVAERVAELSAMVGECPGEDARVLWGRQRVDHDAPPFEGWDPDPRREWVAA